MSVTSKTESTPLKLLAVPLVIAMIPLSFAGIVTLATHRSPVQAPANNVIHCMDSTPQPVTPDPVREPPRPTPPPA